MFTEGVILEKKESLEIQVKNRNSFRLSIYPRNDSRPEFEQEKISYVKEKETIMDVFEIKIPPHSIVPEYSFIQENKIRVSLPEINSPLLNDLFLVIDYTGDTGMGFIDGELVVDQFYYGEKWSIGLKRFLDRSGTGEMVFYFRPQNEDAPLQMDLPGGFLLEGIEIHPEYSIQLKF